MRTLSPIPTTYLLNYITLQGGTIEVLYNLIVRNGPISSQEIRQLVDYRPEKTDEDHVKNGLDFLRTIELVSADLDDVYSSTGEAAEGVSFKLKVIAALRKATGKQADFLDIHGKLVRAGHVSLNDDELIVTMNRREFVTPGLADLNVPKAGWWIRTADYLGIIQQLHNKKRFLVMPAAGLVLAMLKEPGADHKQIALVDWLRHVESTYIYTLRADGTLHPGLAAVLSELAAVNQLRLTYKDDSQAFQLATGKSVTHLQLMEEDGARA